MSVVHDRGWPIVGVVSPGPRAELWRRVFERNEVPLRDIVPLPALLPGESEPDLVYEMDLSQLTDEERQRLIETLSDLFEIPAAQVADELDVHGVPVLADGVVVMVYDEKVMRAMV